MREVIKECRKLAAKYGVKVYFKPLSGPIAGYCNFEDGVITINSHLISRQEILSTFFHEYFHWHCHKKGLWKNYHDCEDPIKKMKTALKAERHIDRLAEMEMYKYDKRLRFLGSYKDADNKDANKFLSDYYSNSEPNPA